jgi:putative (di)nucleoside polyphosphate hydrolase
MGQFFRANVGIAVCRADGRLLALERYDVPGSWQFPQGGLDDGEEPLDAARRELAEETGLSWEDVQLLGEHPAWLAYELAPEMRSQTTGRGQVQKWFVVEAGADAAIDLSRVEPRKGHPEFRDWAWLTAGEVLDRAAPFRLPVYEPVIAFVGELRR